MVGYVVDFMFFVCCICSGSIARRPEIKSVIYPRTGSDKMHLVIRQIGFFCRAENKACIGRCRKQSGQLEALNLEPSIPTSSVAFDGF